MSDDDLDPMQRQLDDFAKKIEKFVVERLLHLEEQLRTVARENAILSLNNTYLDREVGVLNKEIMALEEYLATNDPVLKEMIERGKRLKAEEVARRKQEDEAYAREKEKYAKKQQPPLPPMMPGG
jgi:hypothetical protein